MEQSLRDNARLWELFEAIALLKDEEDAARFLRDLCTLGELKAMAERWQIARMVEEGMPYRKISRITGASTATVTRIAHWLRHGEGGYRALMERVRSRRPSDRNSRRSENGTSDNDATQRR